MNVQLNSFEVDICLTVSQVKKQNIVHIKEAPPRSPPQCFPLSRCNQGLMFYIHNFIVFVKIILTLIHIPHPILVSVAFEVCQNGIICSTLACVSVLFLNTIQDSRLLHVTTLVHLHRLMYEYTSFCLSVSLLLDLGIVSVFRLPWNSATVHILVFVS